MDRMGSEPNLSVKWPTTIGTMKNFDSDGDVTCKQALNPPLCLHYLVGIHRPDVDEPHGDSDVLVGADGARLQGERRVAERAVRETVAEREEWVPVVVAVRVTVHRVVCDGRNLWRKDTFSGMLILNSIQNVSMIKYYRINCI